MGYLITAFPWGNVASLFHLRNPIISIFKYFLLDLFEIPQTHLPLTHILEAQWEKRAGVGRSYCSGVIFHLIPPFQHGSLFLHVSNSAYYLLRKICFIIYREKPSVYCWVGIGASAEGKEETVSLKVFQSILLS